MEAKPYKETPHFIKWREGLKDQKALGRVMTRIVRLCCGLAGDSRFLDRVYYTEKDRKVIILLVGGDKRTQSADVELAKKLAAMI